MAVLVSVALSTFNGARHLAEQIESLLAQRSVEFNVVAVDDASSDDSRRILEAYAAKDRRLRWSANPHNLGPTKSFERALSMCEGHFLAPCDQDDIWHEDKLARLVDAIGASDLAYCDSEYIDADGTRSGRRLSQERAMMQGFQPARFLLGNSISGHACLFHRSLFEASRPFPDGAYHDWWLALCAAGRGGITYVPEVLVDYRRHDAALSPMGPGRSPDRRSRSAMGSRCWLEERLRLMQAYARAQLAGHDIARRLGVAIQIALDDGEFRPLAAALWASRQKIAPQRALPAADALKRFVQIGRKVRRARGGVG